MAHCFSQPRQRNVHAFNSSHEFSDQKRTAAQPPTSAFLHSLLSRELSRIVHLFLSRCHVAAVKLMSYKNSLRDVLICSIMDRLGLDRATDIAWSLGDESPNSYVSKLLNLKIGRHFHKCRHSRHVFFHKSINLQHRTA